ncbi:amidase [Bradyrhizobium sp.]|uniref:amidase n=1 Tax=Bradyrhizobium sp. TaxID=376 RepID=UPI003C192995
MTQPAISGPIVAAKRSFDLARLSATDLIAGYRSGRFTPVDVIEEVIGALRATDALCNIVVTEMYDAARTDAERAASAWTSGEVAGALTGVPVTIKDLLFVAGVGAYAGAPTLAGFVPDQDSAVVSALRSAGAVLTCKTTTCESGYKLTADSPLSGITRNPWRLDRTSGGSSGGAAAAVAAGCGPLAIGTDAVGSIRVPASFCGVFGLKPTFGLVPRSPSFFPPSWGSLAHTGPIGRTVADVALLLGVVAQYDQRDAVSLPVEKRQFRPLQSSLAGLRIAASLDFGFAAVAPSVANAFTEVTNVLADLDAEIIELKTPLGTRLLEDVLQPIGFTEQAAAVMNREAADMALSESEFRSVVAKGRKFRGIDYVEALHKRAQLRGRFLEIFKNVDAVITPTVAVTAFEAGTIGVDTIDGQQVDQHLGWSPFSWPINLAGLPAATVPCGFDAEGMPIGFQIIAPWLGESTIFRIAAAFEQVRPWAGHWPSFAQ